MRLVGRRLTVLTAPYIHAELFGAPPAAEPIVLADRVARLDLAYAARGGPWVETWTADTLPALVRVTVVFPPGDARHWPPIIAATARERPEE